MRFAIDGTLWESYRPDLYDRMAMAVLEGLEALGHPSTFLGKARTSPLPPAGHGAPPAARQTLAEPNPPQAARWMQVESNFVEKVLPGGWLKRSVPRVIREGSMDRWVSWTGENTLPGGGQRVFLKDVSELLWGASPKAAASVRAKCASVLKDPTAEVITFSQRAAEMLGGSRIHALPPFYGAAVPASWEAREAAKATFSDRKEYFLWVGTLDGQAHWRDAMKAFSQFKIRQRSQMQLLMAPWKVLDGDFGESLASYKYRADVKVLDPALWERAAVGAYALLYTPRTDELGWMVPAAMAMEVPLVSTTASVAREWAEEAVEWVDPGSPAAIVEAMLRLYKDETYRSRLLARGKAIREANSGEVVLRQYEQVLTKALNS